MPSHAPGCPAFRAKHGACSCGAPKVSVDLDLQDAARLLRVMLAPCDDGTSDHAWRKCRRCLLFHELQNHQEPATRVFRATLSALERDKDKPCP
jgi:hypothetical protein